MFALITGSGFYDIPDLTDRERRPVTTPYGSVELTVGRWHGHDVAFLPRHGARHSIPPHAIDYRSNVWALRAAGAEAVVATAVSGAIDPVLRPGQLVVVDDVIDFTSGRRSTFFDDETDPGFGTGPVVHTDMTHPYDPTLRALVVRAAAEVGVPVVDGGVYCATNGPRFETPAEIRMMAAVGGHLVGMTGQPEVTLAREAGLPYASIAVVSNPAAGLGAEELSIDDIVAVIETTAEPLYRLIGRTIALHAGHEVPEP
ncbi:MAG: S-methyl-5'-thioinosine phosphorylase [Acidimicrobiales bacterium]